MNNGKAKNCTLCTLAVGEKYVQSAVDFVNSLGENDNNFLVVTDKPSRFPQDITTIQFVDDGTDILQQRRHVIKEALSRFNTAFFVDADFTACHKSEYNKSTNSNSTTFPTIDPVLPFGINSNLTKKPIKSIFDKKIAKETVLNGLSSLLSIDIDQVYPISCASFFFTKDAAGSYMDFFDTLDRIVIWLKDNKINILDDIIVAFAAAKTNVPIYGHETTYPWSLIQNSLAHKLIGDWRKDSKYFD